MLIYVKGIFAALLATLNVLVMALPFFSAVLLKLLSPSQALRRQLTRLITALARQYNRHNGWIFQGTSRLEWRIEGLDLLNKRSSYLVVSNHQSWADIPVLQTLLEPRIPLLKFFLKKELIWIPVLGAAWWALDFPFMKRHTREYLAKHPEKKGQDFAETKRMCKRFKDTPVSVMNFLEGTRFTLQKHKSQHSPYQHLLKPKAGGAALVITSMNGHIETFLDISVHYHLDGEVTLWKLYSGQINTIDIRIKEYQIPPHYFSCDYESDDAFKKDFKNWIDGIWQNKDEWLAEVKARRSSTP